MHRLLLFLAIILATSTSAQQYNLLGTIADTNAAPVANASVSLLDPADSTLAYFGISNPGGQFEIRAVKGGSYLLQIAGAGYRVYYTPVQVSNKDLDLGYFILRRNSLLLEDVVVKGEKVPMMLRGDTVEYNASAFRVKPDAAVEDLLRKMPGIQVDKSGNIKAHGKDVKKVLVDGKEFFGDDPKMATKNLPADAVDKVQVFGNKSDAAQFTGIDDGERDQTINLQLKDGRRKGYFGDEEVGGGTDGHYKLSGKVYRFQPQSQFSMLGMLNNINQFGFTFQDYLSFQGGLRNMMDGNGQMGMQMNRNMPVNFGQPVSGLITSGGAGINYSASSGKANRFSVSYLGNGASKELSQQSLSRNFIGKNVFTTNEDQEQQSSDYAHRFKLSWRRDIDSTQQVVLRGSAVLTSNKTRSSLNAASEENDTIRNVLSSLVLENGTGIDASVLATYIKTWKSRKWPVWKLNASARLENSPTGTEWYNSSRYFGDSTQLIDHQYQDNDVRHITWEAGSSILRRLSSGYYLEPSIRAGSDRDAVNRSQGQLPAGKETDSLSPDFRRTWRWVRPGVSFRHNTTKTQLSIALEADAGNLQSEISGRAIYSGHYQFLRPSLFYQNMYAPGRQFNVVYNTDVTPAGALQMLPVTNYLNPLQRLSGNSSLVPEFRHVLQANWLRFDQFAATSLSVHARMAYTNNKVSIARNIRPDLSEDDRYVNMPDDFVGMLSGEFSMPIRRLGMKLTISLDERYNRGMSLVNDATYRNTNLNHDLRLTIANRARKYWDIACGLEADITSTRTPSNDGANNNFYHYSGYAQISYKPSDRFHFSMNASVDQYYSASFPKTVTVPLINAAASWYFLNNRRGVLTLDAFDLMNRNTSVQRISQLNYLLERRTNIIQQYFLLSFKYRLSKGGGRAPVSIEIRR